MSIEYPDEASENLSAEVVRLCIMKAMHYLQYSDRTEYQLRQKLKEGEFPPSAIDEAVDYVKSFHYIDDRRYAESYIRVSKERKSVREIREGLRNRGIDRDLADEVLEEAFPDEISVVKKQAERKYGAALKEDRKLREKAVRYFSSRGFSYSVIRKALDELEFPEESEEA